MSKPIEKLTELKQGLQQRDPNYCGNAPAWILETVLENLEKTLSETASSGRIEDGQVTRFARGGIRYVADQDASDCDTLLRRLNELLE